MKIETPKGPVSASLSSAGTASPLLVLAHGAGGDMNHRFLKGFAEALAEAGVSCLRFNFWFSEQRKKSPDSAAVLRGVWDAAFQHAVGLAKEVWVGGKSMGGRYASMMVADGMNAAGLVFLGYPLHAPGKTDKLRDEHLYSIKVPLLFIQGTNDPFAKWNLLESVVNRLKTATLHPLEGEGHSFKTPAAELAVTAASFIKQK